MRLLPGRTRQACALAAKCTWTLVTINAAIKELMQTYLKHPPRKLQSEGYAGPVTITQYRRFQDLREQFAQEGFNIGLPTGN